MFIVNISSLQSYHAVNRPLFTSGCNALQRTRSGSLSNVVLAKWWNISRVVTVTFVSFTDRKPTVNRCSADVAAYLLDNLCCLPFRTNYIRPKYVTLIQIWFLLKTDRSELDKTIELANEQSTLSRLTVEIRSTSFHPLQSVIGATFRIWLSTVTRRKLLWCSIDVRWTTMPSSSESWTNMISKSQVQISHRGRSHAHLFVA